jgi:hypothetical protein
MALSKIPDGFKEIPLDASKNPAEKPNPKGVEWAKDAAGNWIKKTKPVPAQREADQQASRKDAQRRDVERSKKEKEHLLTTLSGKGATEGALFAARMAYEDPAIANTMKKLFSNMQKRPNYNDPKEWLAVHETLTDPKSGEFFSKRYEKRYSDEVQPPIEPLVPKEPPSIAKRPNSWSREMPGHG